MKSLSELHVVQQTIFISVRTVHEVDYLVSVSEVYVRTCRMGDSGDSGDSGDCDSGEDSDSDGDDQMVIVTVVRIVTVMVMIRW